MSEKKKMFSWRLGEYMVQKGWINFEQLQEALSHQALERKNLADAVSSKSYLDYSLQHSLSLGEILVRNTWLTWEQLETGLNEQQRTKELIGGVLIKLGLVSEENLHHGLAIQFNRAFVDLNSANISSDIIRTVRKETAERFAFVPYMIRGDIFLAVRANPTDTKTEQQIRSELTAYDVNFAVSSPSQIAQALKRYYP